MTIDTFQLIAFIFTAVSAVAAAVAAIASWMQARSAAKASEASAYLSMFEKYGADDMRTAIAELSAFWRNAGGASADISAAYGELSKADPSKATTLRGYARKIATYFLNIDQLHAAGLISKRLALLLLAHPGYNVFGWVAVPINNYQNPANLSGSTFERLRKLLPQFGTGMY